MKNKIHILNRLLKYCAIGITTSLSIVYAAIVGVERSANLALLTLATGILINTVLISQWTSEESHLSEIRKVTTSSAGLLIGIALAIIALKIYTSI